MNTSRSAVSVVRSVFVFTISASAALMPSVCRSNQNQSVTLLNLCSFLILALVPGHKARQVSEEADKIVCEDSNMILIGTELYCSTALLKQYIIK